METEAGRAPRRDAEKEGFWRETMREAEGSGKSVREFCGQKGLKEHQFYSWRRELKLRDAEAGSGSGFVELVTRRGADGHGGVSIRVGNGLVIEVRPGFDAQTLRAALAVVAGAGK